MLMKKTQPLIEVQLSDTRWKGLELWAYQATRALQEELKLPDALEVSLLGTDDAEIRRLNGQFRGKSEATNVLSWPTVDRKPDHLGFLPNLDITSYELGDIALSYDTCLREAETDGKSLEAHVLHLLVHGLLHLLGFDHESDKDAQIMENIEVKVLARLGVANPYIRN